MAKLRLFKGLPLFDAFVQGEPPYTGVQNFVTKRKILGAAHSEDFVILACTVLIQCD